MNYTTIANNVPSNHSSLSGSDTLLQYQQQLQASQAVLGQLPHFSTTASSRPPPSTSTSVSTIAAQQQQLLMNKAQESHSQLQLDKSRVTLLLEINAELLKEVMALQPTLKSAEDGKNSPEFRESMRRLQANLAYLAAIADRTHKPGSLIPPCPAILLAPTEFPALEGLYRKLQELYPGVNPANPPVPSQQSQQNSNQLGAPGRNPQNLSARPPPLQLQHGGQPQQQMQVNHQSPGHVPSHSPPPQHHMSHQPQPSPGMQGMPSAQQMYAQSHSPMQNPGQMQQGMSAQYSAHLQQQRAAMMQRVQQQQGGQMPQQMGIPSSMGGMGMTQPGGMPGGIPVTSMGQPQQGMGGMMGGMGMGGNMGQMGQMGMGGISIGSMESPVNMGGMASMGGMVGGMPAASGVGGMGQMGMANVGLGMGGMGGMGGGMPAGMGQAGFGGDMSQGMWNGGWQGGGA